MYRNTYYLENLFFPSENNSISITEEPLKINIIKSEENCRIHSRNQLNYTSRVQI